MALACAKQENQVSSQKRILRPVDKPVPFEPVVEEEFGYVEEVQVSDLSESLAQACQQLKLIPDLAVINRERNTLCPADEDFSRYRFHLESPYSGIGEPFIEFLFSQELPDNYSEYTAITSMAIPVASEDYIMNYVKQAMQIGSVTIGGDFQYEAYFFPEQDIQVTNPELLEKQEYRAETKFVYGRHHFNAFHDVGLNLYKLGRGVYVSLEEWVSDPDLGKLEFKANRRLTLYVSQEGQTFTLSAFRTIGYNQGHHDQALNRSKQYRSHRVKTEYAYLLDRI